MVYLGARRALRPFTSPIGIVEPGGLVIPWR
jgi:hypothetical protein